ncbi:Ni/Fe hydrogenase subunit alpha [candidate division WOR-3 bacterium]|uniref:Ni/Fe hydrogenase subunit alpha n=1 Tax=candidate division WOR-3 bacterium TaxID=2052148 RepID=A0A937XGZ3_UNCW3|nr:Ni/Fe hydrogenase subunit alpha [candidate division WOR-3 bacterium]
MSTRITIDPITRLEGHGKIEIFLDDKGEVENAYLQVPELRGFEQFCVGRKAEDMPQLTSRICGVCPVAHHYAGVKALDEAFGVKPTETALKLRELIYCGYIVYDHVLHFYFLGGPDFVVGPDAPKAKRNILGVIEKVGVDTAREVIKHRAYGQRITEILGGKPTHPVSGVPGGQTKVLTEEGRKEIETMSKSCVEFAKFTLQMFEDVVLKNPAYMALITNPKLGHAVYNMGMVDEKNRVAFYDGKVRVTDQKGKEFVKFEGRDYLDHIAEHVLDWSYVKATYLKAIGYRGLVDGPDSGLYRVGPLGRLNVADGMATPGADAAYRKLFDTFGTRPVNSTLAYHWARLVELLYASERALELATDPGITGTDIRNMKFDMKAEGVGVVEAARGTLFHHYRLTEDRMIEKVNLIVATTNNKGPICMSVREAAKELIHKGKVDDGLLNTVEMFFRAYDPCFGCASHVLGRPTVVIDVRNQYGDLVQQMAG